MKTKLIIAATAAFFIAGCDSAEERNARLAERASKRIIETQIVLHDGRKIACIVYNEQLYESNNQEKASGLSCDWHNTPQPK
jgi:protein involved in sex pheromone biosynthesis